MDYLLAVILITATIIDIKYRRIPNWLIGSGLILALWIHFLSGGTGAVIFALKGFALGIGLLWIPFAVGGIGAGDVKLLGLVGAFKGVAFVVSAFLWMAFWGGLMAVFVLYRKGQLGRTLVNLLPGTIKYRLSFSARPVLAEQNEKVTYPYALAIALGVFCSYLKGWW